MLTPNTFGRLRDNLRTSVAQIIANITAATAGALAPGYLASVATAAYAAYGAHRTIAAYSGPLFQLRRSDGTTMDVSPQSGGDYPNYPAIGTWAAGSALTVTTLYDQTGNARHLTQATVASQPSFDLTQMVNGEVPILLDGVRNGSYKSMTYTGAALDYTALSAFLAIEAANSIDSNELIEFQTAGGGAPYCAIYANQTAERVGFLRNGTTNNTTGTDAIPRIQKNIVGVVATPSGTRVHTNNAVQTFATSASSAPMGVIALGGRSLGAGWESTNRIYSLTVFNAALSTTDATAVVNSLNTAHSIYTSYDYRLVIGDDSIQEGFGMTYLQNMPGYLRLALTKRADVSNLGIYGQLLNSVYTARAVRYPQTFTSGLPSIVFIEGATNDLTATSGNNTGATVYNNVTVPLITYLQGLGHKVVLCTLTPRNGQSANFNTEYPNYNALVRANAGVSGAGIADYVLDLAAHPIMGVASAPANTALYVDGTHPASLGYRYLAGAPSGTYANQYTYYYAVQQVLRIMTGNAGYVP